MERERLLIVLQRRVLLRAIRHARDQASHLIDDLGLVRAERSVRLGMRGRQLHCRQ